VDVEQEEAWLSFRLNGKEIKWNAKVEHDWIDAAILSNFVQLLTDLKSDRKLTYLDLKGQDCIIGCSTPEQLTKLRKLTGLNFEWLK
jgi:hypothetical protein